MLKSGVVCQIKRWVGEYFEEIKRNYVAQGLETLSFFKCKKIESLKGGFNGVTSPNSVTA